MQRGGGQAGEEESLLIDGRTMVRIRRVGYLLFLALTEFIIRISVEQLGKRTVVYSFGLRAGRYECEGETRLIACGARGYV